MRTPKKGIQTIIRYLNFFTLLCGMLFTQIIEAQNYVWAKGEGGVGNDAAFGVASDNSGNCYVVGNFAGSADFSGTIYQGRELYDMFIVKYDAVGNVVWVKTAGGRGNDQGNAIKLHNNNLYVCGYFEDTAYFENTKIISRGRQDIFLAKYDLSGNLVWVKNAGGSGSDNVKALDIDNNGNVYITGFYENSIQFGTTTLNSANFFNESFYAKYNNNGILQWAKTTTGSSANQFTGIAFDKNESVFLTGFFGGNFTVGNQTIASQGTSYDIALAKIDADGNTIWLKKAGSMLEDAANAVAADNNGNAIITGYFTTTAWFDNNSVTYRGYNDVFTAKYDGNGNNLWVLAGKGQELDIGYAVTTDAVNNIFVTGMFQDNINFNDNIVNGIDRDPFIISYSPDGVIRWITRGGGGNTEVGLGLSVNANNRVFLAGYYLYFCRFGNIELGNANFNDFFVAVYDPPFVSGLNDLNNTQISVYPNPAQNYFTVEAEANTNAATEIKVCSPDGKNVFSSYFQKNVSVNTDGWKQGIYFVYTTTNGLTNCTKVCVVD
jgi:predicted heme/steroid binding protein